MTGVKNSITFKEFSAFVDDVYGRPNDRHFSAFDMATNIERFIMRALKGIRKEDAAKTEINLLLAFSWFTSLMNQLHIDIEESIWNRFPYLCSYCGTAPCSCKVKKPDKRQTIEPDPAKRPRTLAQFQEMFNAIYPARTRTLEHAGIHLAEETGEFSEALLAYRGSHQEKEFANVKLEAADLISCIMGVFNSAGRSIADGLTHIFSNNCHVCHKKPCRCNFNNVISFKS